MIVNLDPELDLFHFSRGSTNALDWVSIDLGIASYGSIYTILELLSFF